VLKETTTRPKHRRTSHFVGLELFDELEGFTDLEARIAALPTRKDRGDAFEVFAEAYLATQKLVGAEQVWPADQVPITVLRECRLPIKDMGADGVYKTWARQYNAYQSKFRTGRPTLGWEELSTFMGLTDQVGERVLFTNCDDLSPVMDDRSGFFCVRGNDLERLTKDDLEAIAAWLRGAAFTPKPKTELPHQSEALEAILKGLNEHDRVTAVMACGTGKTLVSLWLAERRRAKRVLVLLPSLALVRQTLHEWLKETRWERPRFIAVCSDPTVAKGVKDALVLHQRDLDFPTTDGAKLRKFLADSGDGTKIVFSTYQSAHVVGNAIRDMEAFDLGVFDEAHKTAGREGGKFGFALEDRNLQIAKRVFLTATPRHYDVRKKDKEGDKALIYSMDQPRTYGPIVHTLSFAEAARRGIICNYKIIISIVTSDMINADLLSRGEVIVEGDVIRARTVANQIAIQKACEEHDLKKIFSFHRSVASARDFTGETASSIRTHLPDYEAYHVNGEMRTSDREVYMKAFGEADRAIMSNARCLTEGVDVPAVDVVAFLSPRKSKVDIVQAAGRAMRKPEGKEMGYVLLPLFLETKENETIEEALERTDFEEAWDVLQAMQEQDAVLAEIIREMREERGRKGGFDDSRLRERVEILGPEISLDVLRSAVSTAIVDQLGVTWDERYGELKLFKDQHGDCNVPQRWWENPGLGVWVASQRWGQKQGTLLRGRKARLDALGFVWDQLCTQWEEGFQHLQAFAKEHSHCRVPNLHLCAGGYRLGTWVQNQRRANDSMPAERKARLDALGFIWDSIEHQWEEGFGHLQAFVKTHGHCRIPDRYQTADGYRLRWWVNNQRTSEDNTPPERKARLDALGFVWDPFSAQWEEGFGHVQAFVQKHGHCRVPTNHRTADGYRLGRWVGHQYGNQEYISAERKARLDALGFVWGVKAAQWEEGFGHLRAFAEQHGHCKVKQNHVTADGYRLGTWIGTQRVNQNDTPAERKARLDALGFIWDPMGDQWQEGFRHLQAFVQKHGHCRVSQGQVTSDGYRLGTWANSQRANQDTLLAERKSRLDALGFIWSIQANQWDEGIEHLTAFVKEHGHCGVSQGYVSADGYRLGTWVSNRRANQHNISAERKARLDSLGFAWDPLSTQWEEGFRHLQAFAQEQGHCRVSYRYKCADGYRLGGWVAEHRTNKHNIPLERKARLDALGFVWDQLCTQWEEGFRHLQAFVQEHGHCRVPQKHVTADGFRLGQWVHFQRRQPYSISAERKARLDTLGFVWNPRANKRRASPLAAE
jgi:superfamily II DNA or RNA helicase